MREELDWGGGKGGEGYLVMAVMLDVAVDGRKKHGGRVRSERNEKVSFGGCGIKVGMICIVVDECALAVAI